MNKQAEIILIPDPKELFRQLATDFTNRAIQAIHSKHEFSVVLAGGNTPKSFFDALTEIPFCREQTPWDKIKFYFGDERYLPATDLENNYHMAYTHLFAKVPIRAENIFRIPTEQQNPELSAQEYASTITNVTFDLIYLGLGENAHTASLMPFSAGVITPSADLVIAVKTANAIARITLTPKAINTADCIIFLVSGSNKARAVWHVLQGVKDPSRYPAQLIHSLKGKTLWFLDQAAAKLLTS